MNRLLTYAGQQPIYLGDIDFLQDSAGSMLTCLARALMNQGSDSLNAILQGVVLSQQTQSHISWTAGVVIIAGELLPIPAGTVRGTLGSTSLYFHVEVVEEGTRTFKDGEEHACWATRTATITAESSGGVAVSGVSRLHVESDDATYEGTSSSANITSASLMKKDGLWYIDAHVSLASGSYTTIGSVSFNILNSAHGAELSQKHFYMPLILELATRVGETVTVTVNILPVYVSFNEYSGVGITMTLSFNATAPTSAGGAGDLKTLLPLF